VALERPTQNEGRAALLLVDFINHLQFPEGSKLLRPALAAARQTLSLKRRAQRAGVSVIYANDNYGDWQSDWQKIYARCSYKGVPGQQIARLLRPTRKDYFVLKPRHSAFYCTPLDPLLDWLKVRTLILTGLTADICVLFTANDAYIRRYNLYIPADCVASPDEERNRSALDYFRRVLKADVRLSRDLRFARRKVLRTSNRSKHP
jgi:nicotinamidase-related amidase